MTETKIYIPTLLTDKVLEGLEDLELYTIIRPDKRKDVHYGRFLKENPKSTFHHFPYILLSITVTSDMVQEILHDEIESYEGHWGTVEATNKIMELLNLNKEEEK